MPFKFLPSARAKQACERAPVSDRNTVTPGPGGLYFNMWRHAAGARLKLGLTWMMLAGAALMELISPWLGAQALNELQKNGTQALSTAAYYGAAILAATVIAWSLHG